MAAVQVLSFAMLVVWQEPGRDPGAYLSSLLVPTVLGALVPAGLVILLGIVVLVRRNLDPRLLAGAVLSALVVGIQAIARLTGSVNFGYGASFPWAMDLYNIGATMAPVTSVAGLVRLQQVRGFAVDTKQLWRLIPLSVGFMLLLNEWPDRVLPDRYPVLSFAVLVVAAALVLGSHSLRLGGMLGFALPVAAPTLADLSARLLAPSDLLSLVSIPSLIIRPSVIALGMITLTLIPVGAAAGSDSTSRAA